METEFDSNWLHQRRCSDSETYVLLDSWPFQPQGLFDPFDPFDLFDLFSMLISARA